MRITVLVENTAKDEPFICRHGLSLLIESGELTFLFDAGPDNALLENAASLGIDLSRVSFAVLSHGHYDHGGGLPHLVRMNPRLPVYLRRSAFDDQRNADGKDIGLDQALKMNAHLVFTEGVCEIAPNVRAFGDVTERDCMSPINGLLFSRGEPDQFTHEQHLLVEEAGRLFLTGGCAHSGIVNILEKARAIAGRYPDAVLSGMHLSVHGKTSGDDYLNGLARRLQRYPSVFYTYHCTGLEPYEKLKAVLGDKITYLSGGSVVTI